MTEKWTSSYTLSHVRTISFGAKERDCRGGVRRGFAADDLDWAPGYIPRYNLAPGQEIVAVRQDAAQPLRRMSRLHWGLIPSWTTDASPGFQDDQRARGNRGVMPSFREPLRSRRCLIPADGFYEWKREGKEKLPFCFTLADESVFAFAGIWDRWKGPAGAGDRDLLDSYHHAKPAACRIFMIACP